jgi:hypothetical protein
MLVSIGSVVKEQHRPRFLQGSDTPTQDRDWRYYKFIHSLAWITTRSVIERQDGRILWKSPHNDLPDLPIVEMTCRQQVPSIGRSTHFDRSYMSKRKIADVNPEKE